MKTIYLKELRENARWAILSMLLLLVLFPWAISEADTGASEPPIIDDAMFIVTTVGFWSLALLLGFLQVAQDHRASRWEFVVHRPISRGQIFRAKLLTGLTLYFLAAGIPLALAIMRCASKGNQRWPFEWAMTLPAIWDLLNGTTVYLAAVLVAARPARWLGTRILPLCVPFLCTFLGFFLALNIGEALFITVLGWLILLPMAYFSFVTDGSFERQPRGARALLSTTLAVGIGICLMVAYGSSLELYKSFTGQGQRGYVSYDLGPTGQVLRTVYDPGRAVRTTDLQGNPITVNPESVSHSNDGGYLLFTPQRTEDIPPMRRRGTQHTFHRKQRYVHFIGGEGRDGTRINWYYSGNRRLLLGFDHPSRQWIGSIGPDGFVAAPGVAQAFESGLDIQGGALHDGKNVYRFDVFHRDFARLMTVDPGDRVINVARFFEPRDGRPLWTTAVLTEKSIRLLSGQRVLFSIPPHFGLPDYTYVSIRPTPRNTTALLYSPGLPFQTPFQFVEVDSQGQTVNQSEAPPWPLPKDVARSIDNTIQAFLMAPVSLLLLIVMQLLYGDVRRLMAWEVWPFLVMAVPCGLAALAVARRSAFDRKSRLAWIAFSALAGVTGLLTLLSTRTLPSRVKCPSCGKQRVVTREQCEQCGAMHSAPRELGIEVFE